MPLEYFLYLYLYFCFLWQRGMRVTGGVLEAALAREDARDGLHRGVDGRVRGWHRERCCHVRAALCRRNAKYLRVCACCDARSLFGRGCARSRGGASRSMAEPRSLDAARLVALGDCIGTMMQVSCNVHRVCGRACHAGAAPGGLARVRDQPAPAQVVRDLLRSGLCAGGCLIVS